MAFLFSIPGTSTGKNVAQFRSSFTTTRNKRGQYAKHVSHRFHTAPSVSRPRIVCKYDAEEEQEWEYAEEDDLFEPELSEEDIAMANEFEEGLLLLNRIILTGRLGADPVLKTIGNDLQVCNFTLAVANEYDPDEGPDQEKTSWFDVETWGSTATYVESVAKKGMRVGITGSLSVSSWQGKDGIQREQPIVTANSFEVLQSRSENMTGPSMNESYSGSPREQRDSNKSSGVRLEDLPF